MKELQNTNQNEMREQYQKQDYSAMYDRLKSEYKHPLGDEDEYNHRPVLTKDEVIENVEKYGWRLGEGRGGGITVFQPNGRILYGSPPPMPLVHSTDPYADELAAIREGLLDLNRTMDHDVLWLGALMTKVKGGDVAAMRLYSEIFVVPKPNKGPSLNAKTVNVNYSNQEERPVKDI